MSVVSCYQKIGAREGPTYRPNGGRTYRDVYLVKTSTYTDDGSTVAAHFNNNPSLPYPGRSWNFANDPGVICSGLTPRQMTDARVNWEVTVTWDTAASPGQGLPPWDVSNCLRWRWDKVSYDFSPWLDLDGKPLLNAAGDRFNPPPLFYFDNPKLILTYNTLTFNPAWIVAYSNAVNSDTFCGVPAGWVKSDAPTATPERAEKEEYWQVTWGLEFAAFKPWNPTYVLNEGPNQFVEEEPGVFHKRIIKDDDDIASTIPHILNDIGTAYSAAEVRTIMSQPQLFTHPMFRQFRMCRTAAFSSSPFAVQLSLAGWNV